MSLGTIGKCGCCGCVKPYPYLSNTTNVQAAFPDNACIAALTPTTLADGSSGVLPSYIGDNNVGCGSGPCGDNGYGYSVWPGQGTPQTFHAAADTVDLNACDYPGFKVVFARKIWGGRFGFLADYVNDPINCLSKYRSKDVTVSVSESASATLHSGSGGVTTAVTKAEYKNSSSASSNSHLSMGGVRDCSGSVTVGDGYASKVTTLISDGTVEEDIPCQVAQTSGVLACISCAQNGCDGSDPVAVKAGAEAYMKSLCVADGDRGIISILVPEIGTFSGHQEDFGAWLASFNYDTTGGDSITGNHDTRNVSGSLTLTDITIICQVTIAYTFSNWYQDTDGTAYTDSSSHSINFNTTVTLSDGHTFGEMQLKAQALLNYWNMADNTRYPWRTDGSCQVGPMVSLWETNGGLAAGYCDTPADPAELAIWDGSVRGAPIDYYVDPATSTNYPVGIYNQGWFDWAAMQQNYSTGDTGDCNQTLCYKTGFFMPSVLPSMATQFNDGAIDTSACGGGWQPFSRYKVNWILPFRPLYVDGACGGVGDGGDAVYAQKWAEIKVPLPAQNYFGPCGAQRVATLLASDCQSSGAAGSRWDGRTEVAWGICGALDVASAVNSGSDILITLAAAAWLKNGDLVRFTGLPDLSDETVAGLSSSVTSTTTFSIIGKNLTTPYVSGGTVMGGAADLTTLPAESWYDVTPKGDYVRANLLRTNGTNEYSIEQQNLIPASGQGIIAIVPPGSPEINNSNWPTSRVTIFTDYPALRPTQQWLSSINQNMGDRYWTLSQDGKISDGAGGCMLNGQSAPQVEARILAPSGAPHTFTTGDGNYEGVMPDSASWGFNCSGVWNLTPSGVLPSARIVDQSAGSALNTGSVSTDLDGGLGTADYTYIL